MTELLIPSAWINPYYRINLILIASLAIFKTISRRIIDITEQPELGVWQRSMLIVFDHCLQESESGGQTLWKNYWHIPHLICLIHSFASIKLRFQQNQMLKLLLILLLLNNYWVTKHQPSIFIQPSKVLSDKGKMSGDNSDRIAYLKRTNFCMYLLLQV